MFTDTHNEPAALRAIAAEAERAGFPYSSDRSTGALLATLAAAKPGGRILELGTGLGAGACWLLSGMDRSARLVTVEAEAARREVAVRHLGDDPRADFVHADAAAWLAGYRGPGFSLIFADCPVGKFERLDEALALLEPGGLYVGDDLDIPPDETEWQAKVDGFLARMRSLPGLRITLLDWSTGLVVAARTAA
ncbi:class I SAM-dependent methyltransferase [Streptomyces sp. YIM 98790]|uniref:O-methyltransferase n=1 Tax=Streptomyces sp. YIM 98790 TaxID=2689077 RepID=UPI00140E032A|nr:class I SAM-dependent methyltransferase [Streptomyces sp. YIM 98790]